MDRATTMKLKYWLKCRLISNAIRKVKTLIFEILAYFPKNKNQEPSMCNMKFEDD